MNWCIKKPRIRLTRGAASHAVSNRVLILSGYVTAGKDFTPVCFVCQIKSVVLFFQHLFVGKHAFTGDSSGHAYSLNEFLFGKQLFVKGDIS